MSTQHLSSAIAQLCVAETALARAIDLLRAAQRKPRRRGAAAPKRKRGRQPVGLKAHVADLAGGSERRRAVA